MKNATASAWVFLAWAVLYSPVFGEEVYQVSEDLANGLDLVSMSGYFADRLKTPDTGASATVTGSVEVDPTVSASHPFTVIGMGGTLTFSSCGKFSALPFVFDGTGTTRFPGVTRNLGAADAQATRLLGGATVGFDNLNVSDVSGTAELTVEDGRLAIQKEINVGKDGGRGVLCVIRGTVGSELEQDSITSSDPSALNVGNSYPNDYKESYGTVILSNATCQVRNVGVGYNTPESVQVSGDPKNEIRLQNGSKLAMYRLRKYRGQIARIVFGGGYIESLRMWPDSHGWLSSEGGGLLILESRDGNPIRMDVGFQTARPVFATYEKASSTIETRGTGDLLFAGWNGGVVLSNPEIGTIVYNHTGKTRFKANGGTFAAKIGTDNALPFGSQTGGIVIEGETSTLSLDGHSAKVNGITGTGTLDATTPGSTLTFGESNGSGEFDVAIAQGSSFASVKTGDGTLVLRRSLPGSLAVQDGDVQVPAGLSAPVSLASLTVADGALFAVAGSTVEVSSVSGSLSLAQGATWRFGSDANLTIDVSGITGNSSCTWRKVGAGPAALTGSSGFEGKIAVENGTLTLAEGTFEDYKVQLDLATDARLSIPDGVTIPIATLTVNGQRLPGGCSYGAVAAEGVTKLDQILGGGILYVPVESAIWTGNGESFDIDVLANWKNLTQLPDFSGGTFTPTFAESGTEADFSEDVTFRGIVFSPVVSTFALRATGNSSLFIGPNGVSASGSSSFEIAAPVTVTDDQVWNMDDTASLTVGGPLSGSGSIAKTGTGTLTLSTGGSSFCGDFTQNRGLVSVSGDRPFGVGGTISVSTTVSGTQMLLKNAKIANPLNLSFPNPNNVGYNYNLLHSWEGSNVVSGTVSVKDYAAYLFVRNGSSLTFDGGLTLDSSWGTSFRNDWTDPGTFAPFYFRTRPVKSAYPVQTSGSGAVKLVFQVPGNAFSEAANGGLKIVGSNHAMNLEADDAFASGIHQWAGTVDLCGTVQHVSRFYPDTGIATTAIVKSNLPALLAITNQTADTSFLGDFTGLVSLSKAGSGKLTLSSRTFSSAGTLEVVSGELALDAASWPNATGLSVKSGATFSCTGRQPINRKSTLTLEHGACLVVGATIRCAHCTVDGEPIADGIYSETHPIPGVTQQGGEVRVGKIGMTVLIH